MNSVMTLNWLEMRRLTGLRQRVNEEDRGLRLVRENACLTQDNSRLRSDYEDLAASTRMWIRLYEAALERANMNASAVESSRSQQPTAR
jgi:hypothetical protein